MIRLQIQRQMCSYAFDIDQEISHRLFLWADLGSWPKKRKHTGKAHYHNRFTGSLPTLADLRHRNNKKLKDLNKMAKLFELPFSAKIAQKCILESIKYLDDKYNLFDADGVRVFH